MILFADIDARGNMRVDGRLAGEWIRRLPSSTIFVPDTVSDDVLISLMDDGDTAIGDPSEIKAVAVKGNAAVTIWRGSKAWGMSGNDAESMYKEWLDIEAGCNELGIETKETGGKVITQLLKPLGRLPRVPLFIRETAKNAVHCGPVGHFAGGGFDVSHLDRRAAFLDALSADFPAPGSAMIRCKPFCERCHLFSGTVYFPPDLFTTPARFGPLNMECRKFSDYPMGYVTGQWYGDAIKLAIDYGGKFIEGEGFRWSYSAPFLAPIKEKIDALRRKYPAVAKAIYTRIWGKMVSGNYWQGAIKVKEVDKFDAVHGCGLKWLHFSKDSEERVKGDTYAPQIGGMICAHNYAKVMREALPMQESVIAMHVDAIWATRHNLIKPAKKVGAFALKGRGPVHYLSQGVYHSEWGSGRQGWQEEYIPNYDDLLAYAAPKDENGARIWNAQPKEDSNAFSIAPIVKQKGEFANVGETEIILAKDIEKWIRQI